MFGWCMTGDDEDCRKEVERFYIETRKGKSHIVMTGEIGKCDCVCHRKREK